MRKFWIAVALLAAVVIGIVVGAALTFVTVIVPRSAELGRVHQLSGFVDTFNLKQILTQIDPSIEWSVLEFGSTSPQMGVSNTSTKWGKVVMASGPVPEEKRDHIQSALQGQAMMSVQTKGWIHSTSSGSDTVGDLHLSTQQFGIVYNERPCSLLICTWMDGREMRVMAMVQEQ